MGKTRLSYAEVWRKNLILKRMSKKRNLIKQYIRAESYINLRTEKDFFFLILLFREALLYSAHVIFY